MNRVRLMTWCPRSVSGMHLPAFAAAGGGLFAEQGLDVEFVPSARAPAAPLPVRVVAALHQRNPIAAVVREDSGRRTPQHLAGARSTRCRCGSTTRRPPGCSA